MIKFVVLLTTAITFNFTVTFGEYLGISDEDVAQEIQLVFSQKPIGVEGGEPVYPVTTQVKVKAADEQMFTISINGGKEIQETSAEVDLSKYIVPQANTYTVMVEAVDSKNQTTQKIFGFSTQ